MRDCCTPDNMVAVVDPEGGCLRVCTVCGSKHIVADVEIVRLGVTIYGSGREDDDT